MASAALPRKKDVQLTAMGKSELSNFASKGSSSSASPEFTPAARSESLTDLSSVEEDGKPAPVIDLKSVNTKLTQDGTIKDKDGKDLTLSDHGTLLDTYGNEFQIPDFTIKDLRDAIPAHCFNRSALLGFSYILRDLIQISGLQMLAWAYLNSEYMPSELFRGLVAWPIFWLIQGASYTGIWVIAHECGHQAFSASQTLNDTVGFVLHSLLFVPYFSWKITHAKHHNSTGNLDRDMVFVPSTREKYASKFNKMVHEIAELAEDAPIVTALTLMGQQAFGWNLYLTMNTSGHNKHENAPDARGEGKKNGFMGGVNHFDPNSPLYTNKDRNLILLSDAGLLITISILTCLGMHYGWSNLFFYYVIPYMCANNWLGKHRSSICSAIS